MQTDNTLRSLVDWYVRDWGPVDWRHLKESPTPIVTDRTYGRMLFALSLIEADSQTMRRRLAATGADRSDELLEFIAVWLAEEGEHARALAYMSRLYGAEEEQVCTRRTTRDIRSFLTWPSLYLARGMPGLCATYCTLGAMQELIALTTYNHLATLADNEGVRDTLRAIARQESRHLRFYRTAACIFLNSSAAARRTTRVLIGRLWRPPGMDLLGDGIYEDVFGPILGSTEYAIKLLQVDRVATDLPGMGEVTVMSRYLQRHGFLSAHQARRITEDA